VWELVGDGEESDGGEEGDDCGLVNDWWGGRHGCSTTGCCAVIVDWIDVLFLIR